ncbi:MAG: 6-carboxytetrahydropterin synthase [Bdellovibrionales bacterium]
MNMSVELTFQFSSAHFYQNKNWSEKKNKEVFGKCYDTHGHGHDYQLKLNVILKNKATPQKVREEVEVTLQALDHHHLNFAIELFNSQVPTTENLTLFLYEKLKKAQSFELISLELNEDPYLGTRLVAPVAVL